MCYQLGILDEGDIPTSEVLLKIQRQSLYNQRRQGGEMTQSEAEEQRLQLNIDAEDMYRHLGHAA
jgi:hypothetical protein